MSLSHSLSNECKQIKLPAKMALTSHNALRDHMAFQALYNNHIDQISMWSSSAWWTCSGCFWVAGVCSVGCRLGAGVVDGGSETGSGSLLVVGGAWAMALGGSALGSLWGTTLPVVGLHPFWLTPIGHGAVLLPLFLPLPLLPGAAAPSRGCAVLGNGCPLAGGFWLCLMSQHG